MRLEDMSLRDMEEALDLATAAGRQTLVSRLRVAIMFRKSNQRTKALNDFMAAKGLMPKDYAE